MIPKRPLKETEFIRSLSRLKPTFQEDNQKFRDFTEEITLMKVGQTTLLLPPPLPFHFVLISYLYCNRPVVTPSPRLPRERVMVRTRRGTRGRGRERKSRGEGEGLQVRRSTLSNQYYYLYITTFHLPLMAASPDSFTSCGE
jgi:hypothetical protein